MYQNIKNPETNRQVSINSKLGQKILANYLEAYQYGGEGDEESSDWLEVNVSLLYGCSSNGCHECRPIAGGLPGDPTYFTKDLMELHIQHGLKGKNDEEQKVWEDNHKQWEVKKNSNWRCLKCGTFAIKKTVNCKCNQ